MFIGIDSLIFPRRCLICSVPDEPICTACAKVLRPRPKEIFGEDFRIFSSIAYDKAAAKMILAAKEDGDRVARRLVRSAIAASLEELLKNLSISSDLGIVWIPSSRKAIRRRGGNYLAPIARELANDFHESDLPRLMSDRALLKQKKKVKDQSKLSASQRNLNLDGAFAAIGDFGLATPVAIIDDVITTGSTLRAAVQALRERNLTIVGAATACASQLRMPIR